MAQLKLGEDRETAGIPLEWAGYTGAKNNAALEERAGRREERGDP